MTDEEPERKTAVLTGPVPNGVNQHQTNAPWQPRSGTHGDLRRPLDRHVELIHP